MAYIHYNPNEPGDRERAYGVAFLGIFLGWGSLGGIIYYLCSFVSLFNEGYSQNVLYSSGFLLLMALSDFLAFSRNTDRTSRKKLAQSFFVLFLGGAVDLVGLIAIVTAISSISHNGTGTLLLCCSIFGTLLVTFTTLFAYRKIKSDDLYAMKLSTDKDVIKKISQISSKNEELHKADDLSGITSDLQYIYCYKCGKKLQGDSTFCSACGAKLK